MTAVVANLTKDLKAAAVAGRLAGVRTILASRESDFPLKNKPYYRWYFTRLASGLLVNSEATRQTVLQSAPWLAAERVHLLYKGIDLEKFRPREQEQEQEQDQEQEQNGRDPGPVVGFAGQLIPRKGLATLMDAWTTLTRERPTARLRLAGAGPLRPDLERWRAQLPQPHKVELPGQVEDMPRFLRGCRLLVMPSLSEGFGLAAAEALACGVPVVATRASSLPEIVLHRRTGLLVPVDDAPALAAAMRELLDDPTTARALGAAGRAHVARNFSRERTLDRLAALTGLAPSPSTGERPSP